MMVLYIFNWIALGIESINFVMHASWYKWFPLPFITVSPCGLYESLTQSKRGPGVAQRGPGGVVQRAPPNPPSRARNSTLGTRRSYSNKKGLGFWSHITMLMSFNQIMHNCYRYVNQLQQCNPSHIFMIIKLTCKLCVIIITASSHSSNSYK